MFLFKEFFLASKQSYAVVVKGSTLGPLLYMNDPHYAFSKSIIHNFADNTNLMFSSKKLGAIESVINNELQHLFQWLRDKKLSLNETKTEPIIFRLPWN